MASIFAIMPSISRELFIIALLPLPLSTTCRPPPPFTVPAAVDFLLRCNQQPRRALRHHYGGEFSRHSSRTAQIREHSRRTAKCSRAAWRDARQPLAFLSNANRALCFSRLFNIKFPLISHYASLVARLSPPPAIIRRAAAYGLFHLPISSLCFKI